jgi:hypothetical protein
VLLLLNSSGPVLLALCQWKHYLLSSVNQRLYLIDQLRKTGLSAEAHEVILTGLSAESHEVIFHSLITSHLLYALPAFADFFCHMLTLLTSMP